MFGHNNGGNRVEYTADAHNNPPTTFFSTRDPADTYTTVDTRVSLSCIRRAQKFMMII